MNDNPNDPQFDLAEYRKRQKSRARVMGIMLGAFAVLFFFITIAKMQLYT